MEQIKGIYAASLSILDQNLALDIENTIKHAENIIDLGCHGSVFFGSTGQSQLVSLSEKIRLINELPNSKYKDKFMQRAKSTENINQFGVCPPQYTPLVALEKTGIAPVPLFSPPSN